MVKKSIDKTKPWWGSGPPSGASISAAKDEQQRPGPETAKLEDYICKAWTRDPIIKPFSEGEEGGGGEGEGEADSAPPPTLRRDRTNRIIYFIGSFNPPHQGHVALLDHVYRHSRDPAGFNAVAVMVMAHGERWVQRKVPQKDAATRVVRLAFDQRRRLLKDGLFAGGKDDDGQRRSRRRSRWLWVLPRDVNAWWTFQAKLASACAEDGFALEFHELLGPDYVKASRPQCNAWHGVVTSNICRPADFDAGGGGGVDGDGGRGAPLLQLAGFGPWEQEKLQQPQVEEERTDADTDKVWMCHQQAGKSKEHGSVRYIRSRQPSLDPDMSSTKMRRIIAESPPDELVQNLRGIATNPELLIQIMQESTK